MQARGSEGPLRIDASHNGRLNGEKRQETHIMQGTIREASKGKQDSGMQGSRQASASTAVVGGRRGLTGWELAKQDL